MLVVTCRHCDPTARAAGSRASRRIEAATKDKKKADARRHTIIVESGVREQLAGRGRKIGRSGAAAEKKKRGEKGCEWCVGVGEVEGEEAIFFRAERNEVTALSFGLQRTYG